LWIWTEKEWIKFLSVVSSEWSVVSWHIHVEMCDFVDVRFANVRILVTL